MQSNSKDKSEYYLSMWHTYHDIVKEYNHKLGSRFSGIYTLLTAAWGILGVAANNQEEKTEKVLSLVNLGNTNISTTALIPVLLTLLKLHEMRIFIQSQEDNYFMIYHEYKLYSECDYEDFRQLLDISQGAGASVATYIFMILANITIMAVPIANIILCIQEGFESKYVSRQNATTQKWW